MRLIHANKYYYLRGGAERYLFELAELQRRHGDEPIPFAMQDAKNEPTEWARFFVSPVQTDRVRFDLQGLRTAGRFVYSFEARKKFGRLLDVAQPEMVHVHNIYHQISPSILGAAKQRKLPVVLTAHDYALVAPNYSLYHDGAICERTKPHRFWAAVRHRCVKGSAAASALTAFEMSLHRTLGLWRRGVDRVIAPSRFVQATLAEYGVPSAKISYVPHFVDASVWQPSHDGSYALYVGRLVPEKGVDVLIRAAARRPEVPVRIVGTGPQEAALKALAAMLGAHNVAFVGAKSGDALRAEYAGARFVVVPSVWYEVFGLVVLEAYASGKPVIASQIGGLAEMVKEGETGLGFSAGDDADLAEQIARLWPATSLAGRMGEAGRMWVEHAFTPEKHYAALGEVYAKAKQEAA